MTRTERTGWRDEELSRRHRDYWGDNCPMADVDFLAAEYDTRRPVAIVDYKRYTNWNAQRFLAGESRWWDASIETLRNLGDAAGVPALVVIYWPDTWAVVVVSLNALARDQFGASRSMSEIEYVRWLYRVRHRSCPPDVERQLMTTQPELDVA